MEKVNSTSSFSTLLVNRSVYINFWHRNARTWMIFVIVCSDLVNLLLAFLISTFIRLIALKGVVTWWGVSLVETQYIQMNRYQYLLAVPLLLIGLLWLRGLYPGNGLGEVEELRRLVVNTSFIFLGFFTITFMGQAQIIYSRFIILSSCLLSLLLIPLGRFFIRQVTCRLHLWGEPVALIGNSSNASSLIRHFRDNPRIGYSPRVCFSDDPGFGHFLEGLPVISTNHMAEYAEKYHFRCAIIAESGAGRKQSDLMTYQAIFDRVSVIDLSEVQQFLWISVQDLGGLMGYEIKQNLRLPWPRLVKRSMDLIISLFCLPLLLPVAVVVAIAIWLDDHGPIFYQQTRIGKDGKNFRFIKFRTMRVNADAHLAEFLAQNPLYKAEWDRYQKLKEDPRITRIGGFLRRFSIDELPQLINVLHGDMSLVGPRPFFVAQRPEYGSSISHYARVRPGMTGMWQVSGRSQVTFAERIKWDEYYIRNWSIWLDLYIMARTVWVVLKSDGSY